MIDWWEALTIFEGGFTLEAADAVCGLSGALAALVEHGLFVAEPGDDETSYWVPESVLAEPGARLAATGDESHLRRRHADYYLELAESAEPHRMGAHVDGAVLTHRLGASLR